MKHLILCVFMLIAPSGHADEGVAKLQKELTSLQSISTGFTQTIFSARFGDQDAKGQLIIVKPNKMSWVYAKPEGRIFMADGETFYRYDQKDKVEHKSDQKELMKDPTSFFFLWDNVQLQDHFIVSQQASREKEVTYLLVPKNIKSDMKKIEMTVSFAPFEIHQLETTDQLGQKNRLQFYDSKINSKVSSAAFDYEKVKKSLENNS